MANIGWVETKKEIIPTEITALLNQLNESKFKNQFIIQAGTGWDGEGYGWRVNHKDNPNLYGSRFYTMTKSDDVDNHTIETEHKGGGGSSLIWWVDAEILNAIAELFEGKIFDEGHQGEIKIIPGGISWEDYLKERWHLRLKKGKKYPTMEVEFTPPAFCEGIEFETE
jgi:hypothetical protein